MSIDGFKDQAVELTPEHAKMLFELHHRQLNETQLQIQSITEKAIGLIFLLTGWIVLSSAAPAWHQKIVLALGVGILGLSAVIFLLTHAQGRRRVALVVESLNEHFRFFDNRIRQRSDPIYPAAWKGYGRRSLWWFVGAHISAVTVAIFVAELAIFTK